ncbi:MAG: rhodanese-like domain-containing protein [Nitriliruptoraceae bacterium]
MVTSRFYRSLIATMLALAMVLTACGGEDPDEGAEEGEELALDLEDEEDEGADEADEADETDEADGEDEGDDEAEEGSFDLEGAVVEYASTIPDGWMNEGDTEAFKEALEVDGAVLIDVREESEFAEGHIPGAVNIPIRTLGDNLSAIPTDQPVWVVCASGWRAGLATSSLRMMGYDNVNAYAPSVQGWEEAGEELVNEDNQPEDFGDPGFEPELVDAVSGFLAGIPDGYYGNSLDEVKQAMDAGTTILDVRQPEEYEEGHIADALSLPLREIGSSDVEIPTDSNVIVMCQSGYRAALALPILHVLGYDNVQAFPGSFAAWEEADEPIES